LLPEAVIPSAQGVDNPLLRVGAFQSVLAGACLLLPEEANPTHQVAVNTLALAVARDRLRGLDPNTLRPYPGW